MPTSRCRPNSFKRAITGTAGRERSHFIDATRLATALLGNSIGANMFMLGYAYQNGGLPLSAEAVEKAIEMNGEAVAMNLAAFRYGRRAAIDPAAVESLITPRPGGGERLAEAVAELRGDRRRAASPSSPPIRARVMRGAIARSSTRSPPPKPRRRRARPALAEAVARYLFKLMAYKDEYEVARLYTDTSFIERVKSTFAAGDLRFEFHLAPPLLAKVDPATGEPKKMSFGPWMLKAFAVLAKFKFLRGTPLDLFGYTEERRIERRLVTEYQTMLDTVMAELSPLNHATAVAIASIPEKIRGFGPIKQRTLAVAKAEEKALYEQFRAGASPFLKAAE